MAGEKKNNANGGCNNGHEVDPIEGKKLHECFTHLTEPQTCKLNRLGLSAIRAGMILDAIMSAPGGKGAVMKILQYSSIALLDTGIISPRDTPEIYAQLKSASKDISTARRLFRALSWLSSGISLYKYYDEAAKTVRKPGSKVESFDFMEFSDIHMSFVSDVVGDLTLLDKYTSIFSPKTSSILDAASLRLNLITSTIKLSLVQRDIDEYSSVCKCNNTSKSTGSSSHHNNEICSSNPRMPCKDAQVIYLWKVKRMRLLIDITASMLGIYGKGNSLLYTLASLASSFISGHEKCLTIESH